MNVHFEMIAFESNIVYIFNFVSNICCWPFFCFFATEYYVIWETISKRCQTNKHTFVL